MTSARPTRPYDGARAGAFDTPTLLSIAYNAPYFHDGSLPTLASVVDWFDSTKGLGLSEAERADLTAYLETVGAGDEPLRGIFDDRNTPFRLAFDELNHLSPRPSTRCYLQARQPPHPDPDRYGRRRSGRRCQHND